MREISLKLINQSVCFILWQTHKKLLEKMLNTETKKFLNKLENNL